MSIEDDEYSLRDFFEKQPFEDHLRTIFEDGHDDKVLLGFEKKISDLEKRLSNLEFAFKLARILLSVQEIYGEITSLKNDIISLAS